MYCVYIHVRQQKCDTSVHLHVCIYMHACCIHIHLLDLHTYIINIKITVYSFKSESLYVNSWETFRYFKGGIETRDLSQVSHQQKPSDFPSSEGVLKKKKKTMLLHMIHILSQFSHRNISKNQPKCTIAI